MGYGANHQAVIQHIYRNNEFTGIQFIGTLLERMQREEQLIRTWFSATELSARNLDESKIE
ncbi:MAG: hypothetical protein Q8O99_07615 [bacterium]|nr:hypothetical protein [bacterium]